MWQFIVDQFLGLMLWMYEVIPNLGLVIIILTLVLRGLILAVTFKSLKATHQRMGKMKEMQAEMAELKRKYSDDKEVLQVKQLELSKRYNINPFAGCLPQILQIVVFILFYQALVKFVGMTEIKGLPINDLFLWCHLGQADPYHIIPVLAGLFQFGLSWLISPGAQVRDMVPNKSRKKEIKEANIKEEDTAEMAASMQKQMMFLMPVMTGFIAWNLPAGMGLYWIVSTIFGIIQQGIVSGWGKFKFWERGSEGKRVEEGVVEKK